MQRGVSIARNLRSSSSAHDREHEQFHTLNDGGASDDEDDSIHSDDYEPSNQGSTSYEDEEPGSQPSDRDQDRSKSKLLPKALSPSDVPIPTLEHDHGQAISPEHTYYHHSVDGADEDDEQPIRRSPLKRTRSTQDRESSQAASVDWDTPHLHQPRPFKRVKGGINPQFIGVLNADIADARDARVAHDWPALEASQVGLTVWAPEEKHFFFEALSRVGRHYPELVARRVGTKGELEVRQYLDFLEDARLQRSRQNQLDPVALHEIPAAVELGQECCAELDKAADALSLRQEAHEETAADRFYGGYRLTTANWRELTEEAMELEYRPSVHPLQFFRADRWLELPRRLFMNSTIEENNWCSVSEEPPSIRIAVLDDFYSLTVSITRRLMAEAIYNARVSARARPGQWKPVRVKASHVPAAPQVRRTCPVSRELFFAECARRLRIDVVGDDDVDDNIETGGPEPMSYEAVESALSAQLSAKHQASASTDADRDSREPSTLLTDEASVDDDEDGDPELPIFSNEVGRSDGLPRRGFDIDLEDEDDSDDVDYSDPSSVSTVDLVDSDAEVEEEMAEALVYSATDIQPTTRAKNALRARIRAERDGERLADNHDRRARYVEERRLWKGVLGREPTVPLERVPEPPMTVAAVAGLRLSMALSSPPVASRNNLLRSVSDDSMRPSPGA